MDINIAKRRARVAAYGRLSPETASDYTLVALSTASARDLRSVLFAFEGMSLTRALSIIEAHHFAERMVGAGRSLHRVAFVISDQCNAIMQHMVTVASNRGLESAAFGVEAEALAWLDGPASGRD